ncbi:putative phage terminase, large subunit [Gleimia coleocanis DSM 15436]|uniref:Putative phage terminase, large subunit n=1 Tax=Gleimia coleocanis DSM 15436 TaxID=525245 RepID=C0VY82_9ACTO|nr:terminase large subunit [Gleimia coleocanis]EEH64385.1 putative phage terminase, large subunit [Gleimia coleocanis DSM 15436]
MTTAKYATQLIPGIPHFGRRVAAVAEYLGTPLMPWQQQVANVVTQIDPNTPGAWKYPTVIVSVPRQAGKTALLRALAVDRMLAYNSHEILMTAQTGKDARKRWKQIITALDVEKKHDSFKVREAQGSERIEYLRRGSYISPFAPTPKSVHGDSLHMVTIDEAWAFDEASGLALEAAINPTQLTILDSQMIVVSTKGTGNSAYLNRLIQQGRQAVTDPMASVAYFEWSADPDAVRENPYSPQAISFHPALGHTQDEKKILKLAESSTLASWKRGILNLDEETTGGIAVIPLEIWERLNDGHPAPPASPSTVEIAFDVSKDGDGASIAAAWKDPAGIHTSLMYSAPGTAWLRPKLAELYQRGYTRITADDSGTNRTIIQDLLERHSIRVKTLSAREYATACQALIDRVKSGEITHDNALPVLEQLPALVAMPISNTLAFSVKHSTGAIDTVRATALAVYRAAAQTPLGIF